MSDKQKSTAKLSEDKPASKSKAQWRSAKDKAIMEREFINAINESKERRRRSKRIKKMCINGLKFFLSTGGLLLLNGIYLVAGAYIFEHLEQKNEKESCKSARNDYFDAENATVNLLMNMAERLDGVGPFSEVDRLNTLEEFQRYIQSFALSVLDTSFDVSRDCETLGMPDGEDLGWSWTGSLVFAVTIITTIGYGHIAPSTMWGRLVCIAYATIGIPLFLMAMSNIGEVLANLFRATYSIVCCCGCCRKKKEKEKTTEEIAKEEAFARKKMSVWRIDEVTGRPIPPSEDDLIEDDEIDEEEEEEPEEMTVPLTITLLVMAGFIVVGAAMFNAWEEWTFADSCYYCYTTLTTIGFGDLVPGVVLTDAVTVMKSLATIFYIVFGMAAISMCIQLMADEVVAKFKWIGDKVGMKKKKEDQGSNSDDEEVHKKKDVESGSKNERKY